MKTMGFTPNLVSILSVVCAALSGILMLAGSMPTHSYSIVCFILAGAFIQCRLLCNLLDGMIAVEGNLKSKTGEIYNELPDRFSDAIILVCAGYSVPTSWGSDIGWGAATLAVVTAYVRTLGAACGTQHLFIGPMAKQQRMVVVTIGCIGASIETAFQLGSIAMPAALLLVNLGCILTILRRTQMICHQLKSSKL
jgi:phosphatidylglycerophosphate synthase